MWSTVSLFTSSKKALRILYLHKNAILLIPYNERLTQLIILSQEWFNVFTLIELEHALKWLINLRLGEGVDEHPEGIEHLK